MAFGEEKPIKIILNGREIKTDVPPQIINNKTFVPIRVISEALGVNVKWDEATRSVILASPENKPVFSVVSYNKINTEYGYVILGEVKNDSPKTFSKAEIKAEVMDPSGNTFDTLTATLPPGITPGETAYFKLRSFADKGYLYSSVNFTITTSDEVTVAPTDVTFSDIRFSRDQDIYNDFTYVTGDIDRSGDDTREYKNPIVQVALFDKDGQIVNCGESELKDYGLHRFGEFKITLEKGPAYANYKLKLFSD